MRVYVCSTNAGKLKEFSLAARQLDVGDVRFEPLPNLNGIRAPQETGTSFDENASLKTMYYSRFTSEMVVADDSGLCVDALNGAPGIYSARYAGPEATDEDNNNLLLRDLGASAHREARFICSLALARKRELLTVQHGVVEGRILLAPRGKNGFGYDPLFFYPALSRSFGELSDEEKFTVSHRGNAIRRLYEVLPRLSRQGETSAV